MSELKVLYIGGAPIGARTATGQALAAMYGGLRSEQIFQLCTVSSASALAADGASASRMRVVSTRGAALSAVAWLRARKAPGLARVHHGFNASTNRVARSARARLQANLLAAADIIPPRIPRRTLDELRAWRPDVIHTPLGGARTIRLALLASHELGVPIVPHLLDDWPPVLYSGGELLGLARVAALRAFTRLIDESPVILCIGRAMAAEYRERYGKQCVVVGNCVDPADYELPRASDEPGRPSAPDSCDGAHELVYVGGLHLGRAEVLLQVARALESMTVPWRLVVHAPARDVALLGRDLPSCLTVGRELALDEVPARLCAASALLFVESLRPEVAAFTRLSVSTKVPQYLASRRPIVAVGPVGQASVGEIADGAGAAVVVHATGDAELRAVAEFLRNLGVSGPLREKALPEAFEAALVQRRFVEALRAGVSRSRERHQPSS